MTDLYRIYQRMRENYWNSKACMLYKWYQLLRIYDWRRRLEIARCISDAFGELKWWERDPFENYSTSSVLSDKSSGDVVPGDKEHRKDQQKMFRQLLDNELAEMKSTTTSSFHLCLFYRFVLEITWIMIFITGWISAYYFKKKRRKKPACRISF